MNAAILLVTSAWMTGQAPEVIVPVQHHAPAASAGNSCGASCCDDDCGVGHRLRGRFRGLFHRDDCCEQPKDDCCDSGGHGRRRLFGHRDSCNDSCNDACDSGHGRRRLFGHRDSCNDSCNDACDSGHGHRRGFGHRRNGCEDACNDSCDSGHGGFFQRLRGLFHRDRDDCCTDACHGGVGVISGPGGGPAAEPLKEQPKKMPSKDGAKEVRVITPPARTPIAPAIQGAPAIDAAPAAAPRIIESDVRNPF